MIRNPGNSLDRSLDRRGFLRGALAAGAMLAGAMLASKSAAGQTATSKTDSKTDSKTEVRRPPNLIFILADDLGYGELGCYGQTRIQTPHLDRMAREGARFTDFYSGSTVCAPSRCALMTGLHTGHCRIRGNSPGSSLQAEDAGLAKTLRKAGYATACIGKWGLGDPGSPGEPSRQGFDDFYGYLTHKHAHNYYPTFLFRAQNGGPAEKVALRNHNPSEGPDGVGRAIERLDYTPDLFASEALKWIENQHRTRRDQPFFLFFAPTIPHGNNEARPHEMEVPGLAPYENEAWPDAEKRKAAMISRLDQHVGQLMAKLAELGLENTLVIFTSDNGPHREGADPDFFDANGEFRGIKRDLFEGGIRVPFIAHWPGQIAPGAPDLPAYFPDVLPTFAALTGTALDAPGDGISLAPTLLGRGAQKTHAFLYWEFYEDGGTRAVRLGNWKGVRVPYDGPIQLFDLARDAGETHDVARQHPAIVARIAEVMEREHVSTPEYNARTARQLQQAAERAREERAAQRAAAKNKATAPQARP